MKIFRFKEFERRRDGIYRRKPVDVAKVLAIAGVAIGVLSAAVWLVRDARDLGASFRPAEGSLIANINTASQDELISVPGIGPTRAAQIVAGRPYEAVDDLAKIAGIGGQTLESLRPFVTVDSETRPRD